MLRILSHTPVWVFALFAGLLVFDLLQTRTRNVRKILAYGLPAGMVALSLSGIRSSFELTLLPMACWAFGLIVATLFVYMLFPNKGMSFSAQSNTFHVPGSWTPLAVIMAIFLTKYAYAVVRALDAALADSPLTATALSLAYGCFSGYFCARALGLAAAARRPEDPSEPTPLRAAA